MPDAQQAPFWFITGAFRTANGFILLLFYTTGRYRFRAGLGGWLSWNPTLALFNVVYISFVLDGVFTIWYGLWRMILLGAGEGPGTIVTGLVNAVPYIAALLYGRSKLFKIMEGRLMKQQKQKHDDHVT